MAVSRDVGVPSSGWLRPLGPLRPLWALPRRARPFVVAVNALYLASRRGRHRHHAPEDVGRPDVRRAGRLRGALHRRIVAAGLARPEAWPHDQRHARRLDHPGHAVAAAAVRRARRTSGLRVPAVSGRSAAARQARLQRFGCRVGELRGIDDACRAGLAATAPSSSELGRARIRRHARRARGNRGLRPRSTRHQHGPGRRSHDLDVDDGTTARQLRRPRSLGRNRC